MSDVYLRSLCLPDDERERRYLFDDRENRIGHPEVRSSVYPFGLFAKWRERTPPVFLFEPVTIFCGSNGCGKSTLLNVIADLLGLPRKAAINSTEFFREYVELCKTDRTVVPRESKIISSDDIFEWMQQTRATNIRIDAKRRQVQEDKACAVRDVYEDPGVLRLRGLQDYDRWKAHYDAIFKSESEFLRDRTKTNLKAESNGESAIRYLTNEIEESALYLLDEPENSLAPALQLELKTYLEESARFFRCQFIIATHSPLLLSISGARIYDFDDPLYNVRKWTQLSGVRVWFDFFRDHAAAFTGD